ncbi:MAG: DUF6338 family protein [Acidimicrobiaceae bacterium]|nr:DUF6338 family protein [Acidimicrobiaceae bacterium]
MNAALIAVLLTAVFITPGMLYRYERNVRCSVPVRRRQRLLHAPATLAIGAATVVAALWVFAFIRWLSPAQTPDVGALLKDFGKYTRDHLPLLGAWATGIYVIALVLAFLAAWALPKQRAGDDLDMSSWQHVIEHAWDEQLSHGEPHLVRIALKEGGVVEGSLYWYSTDPPEVADRDLVLTYPRYIGTAPEGSPPLTELEHLIVPASQMRFLTITYR